MQKRLEVERTYFSLFPQTEFVSLSSMYKCKYVRCCICQIYLLGKNEFTFAVCDKTYKEVSWIVIAIAILISLIVNSAYRINRLNIYIYIDIRNANFKCVTLNIYEKKNTKNLLNPEIFLCVMKCFCQCFWKEEKYLWF